MSSHLQPMKSCVGCISGCHLTHWEGSKHLLLHPHRGIHGSSWSVTIPITHFGSPWIDFWVRWLTKRCWLVLFAKWKLGQWVVEQKHVSINAGFLTKKQQWLASNPCLLSVAECNLPWCDRGWISLQFCVFNTIDSWQILLIKCCRKINV